MSSIAQNQDSDPQPVLNPASELKEVKLPERYKRDGTVACMLFAEYSEEAKQAIQAVKLKAKEWFGEKSSNEDSGRIFDMSMTLFLTPQQHVELLSITRDTPLQVHTVKDFAEAIERGVRGEIPRPDQTEQRRAFTTLEYGVNAGYALAEFTTNPGLPWEKQRLLAFYIWNGMTRLQNFAASMLQNVQADITGILIANAEAAKALPENANVFHVAGQGIYQEAARLTSEYAAQSAHLAEVQQAMLPLARALLASPSPIMREVVYSQLDSDMNLLGRGLGLYDKDPAAMLQSLDDWKQFWDTQVPLLSRYFRETELEKAQAKAAVDSGVTEKERSMWNCRASWQGDKVALTPCKWDETMFNEIRHEHVWAMKFLGATGAVGDRTFEIVSNVISAANAEALACRPAYGQTLVERERGYFPDLSQIPAEHRKGFEELIERKLQEKMDEARNLVHGISDLMISALPWRLPRKDLPLAIDPQVHLERTLSILENGIAQNTASPGLAYTARLSAQELAIQLEHWDYVNILDSNPILAARVKALCENAKVHLPDDWSVGLRQRGILPLPQTSDIAANG